MFTSVEALCHEFGLDTSLTYDQLMAELTHRRASIHPDKWNGDFVSEAAKTQFSRISEALKYLKDQKSTPQLALARTDEVRNLTTIVTSLQSLVEQVRLDGSMKHQAESTLKQELSGAHRTFQIAAGTFATIFTTIIAFSEKLSTNPVLAPIAASPAAKRCILSLWVLSGVAFLLTWVNEHRLKNVMQFLLSDEGISTMVFWCVNDGPDKEPKLWITKQQIVHNILRIEDPWHASILLRRLKHLFRIRVPHSFAERVADIQLSELTERGVIHREGTRGVVPLYVIEMSRAKEIIEDRGRRNPYSPIFW